MKILKGVLFAILAFIVLALLTAAFLKKEYAVEEEITINKSKTEVFEYVKYLKNQDEFSKWASMDPDMKKTYRGTDGTVGFVSAWESENDEVGVGEQEIVAISEGERIDYELRFISPFEGISPCYMITETVDENTTKVKWGFKGSMPYPMNILIYTMNFEELIAADFQKGLDNLKSILES